MEEKKSHWSETILYNLAWLICSLLIIVDILGIREATLDVMTAVQARRIEASAAGEKVATQLESGFTVGAVDQALLFGGGIVAVSLAIAIEYYFRKGKEKGQLFKRIGIVLGIQVAVFLVCVLIQTLV